MHSILVEPGFADSIWCKQILQGLTGELKKRRESYAVDPETLSDCVFVIGSSAEFLSAQVSRCNGRGIVPVLLCSSVRKISGGRYHCVCPDIGGSMGQLTAALTKRWGQRLVLYGVNPNSVGDRSRREAFEQACPGGRCMENRGSPEECFAAFLPCLEETDAVLCANGFAAVSLYRRLREMGRQKPIISCAQTLLCHRYGNAITSVEMNYPVFGKTALAVADLARKQAHISELTVTVRWSVEGLSDDGLPAVVAPVQVDRFYEDEELRQMLKVEDLLSACDSTDTRLLSMLLEGKSYGAMAAACFLTEGAVKYRIKNMRALCDCPDRESLEALLRTYLPGTAKGGVTAKP